MNCLGIDPSSSHIGYAVVRDGVCQRLGSIRPSPIRIDSMERLFYAIRDLDETWRVAIEQPPPTAHANVNHGHQAIIGYAIGRVTGTIEHWCWSRGIVPELVEVSTWRDAMLVEAARRGLLLERPGKASHVTGKAPGVRARFTVVQTVGHGPGSGKAPSFDLLFDACGHRQTVGNLDGLKAAREAAAGCPTCSTEASKPQVRPEDDVRDAWKATACRFAGHVAPEAYAALVADALSRAKSVEVHHRLAGVADACESLGVAFYLHNHSLVTT